MPDYKQILLGLTLILLLGSYVPYIKGILQGRLKPHMFSWVIWGLINSIAFAIQVSEQAGWGSVVMGLAAVLCLATAALSLTHGERNITRSDWISFISALAAILLWWATKDPFYSVILITLIELLGFYPTFRKSLQKPFEENISIYLFSAIRCVLSIFVLDIVNFNTAFYPAATCAINLVFVAMLAYRRKFPPLNR